MTGIARRITGTVIVVGFLAGVAVLAPSAPMVGSGPISIPQSGPQTIWPQPPTPKIQRVGVSVSVGSASPAGVQVQATPPGGTSNNLGDPLQRGGSCVFEGVWDAVTLMSATPGTSPVGTWSDRAPTCIQSSDPIVGSGTVDISTAYTNQTVYSNSATPAVYRLIAVSPATAQLTVNGPTGALIVNAGNWSFYGAANCQSFSLSAQGRTDYTVYDLWAGAPGCNGDASGSAGATDSVRVDGQASLNVTITNKGSSIVSVTSATQGNPPQTVSLPSGAPGRSFPGNLTQLQWTYQGGPGKVNVSVTGQ